MARIHHVRKAQQRYVQVPVVDDDGNDVTTAVMRRDGTPKKTKTGREVTRRQVVDDRSQPLPPHDCGYCHKPIEVGTPYKWVKIKSGPYGGRTLRRHAGCPPWKQSELTTSKMAGIYAAQEDFEASAGSCESAGDFSDLMSTFADAVREVASEYEESADNIEEGFGHETYVSSELREKAEQLNDWADNCDESFDEVPECEHPDLEEGQSEDECEHCEDGVLLPSSPAFDEWRDEQFDRAQGLVYDCPI
jgi:hypothetical protein